MKTLFAGSLVVMWVTACSGSSTSTTPVQPCPAIATAAILNYPADGSAGVVDEQNVIVVSDVPAHRLYLRSTAGVTLVSTPIVPVPQPLPTPNIPLGSLPAVAFGIPALAAATTYTVTDVAPGSCSDGFSGSFTTR